LPIFPELNNTQLQQILVALGVDLANISKDLPTTSLLQVA